MKKFFISPFLILIQSLLNGCIGIDHVDDPRVEKRIEISTSQVSMRIQENQTLSALFYNEYGVLQDVVFTWTSSQPSIVSVSDAGLLTAQQTGQAMVVASFGETQSASVNVNVVLDDSQVALVEVISQGNKTSLALGEQVNLLVGVRNINQEILEGKTVEWFSENSSIATVDEAGVVTGISSGRVNIHAKVNGVKSNVINFLVGDGLSGSFIASGGYKAIGMASVRFEGENLILSLSNNFETSFALGTFIYMANVTNGAQVRANGLVVAQITTNGAKTFNLSAIQPQIGLDSYQYVIILCKPASITFGHAELK